MTSREPYSMRSVIGDLMARRGYGRVRGAAQLAESWHEVAGPRLAASTRLGPLRRGTLEVVVASSVALQEITFQKAPLLAALQQRLPAGTLRDLRFRIGPVDAPSA